MKSQDDVVIQIDNLVKTFGQIRAVDDLSLSIEKGILYGFLGPNGSGKSTTLRMLTSLIKPDSGSLALFGKDIKAYRAEVMSRVGALIERPNFYEHFSATKNLKILQGYAAGKVDQNRISEVLELTGLTDRADSKVSSFSDGMKQRLGLAQALLNRPELLILDEPFNSLDPKGVRDVRELITYLNTSEGITVMVSSHNLDEIEKLCSHMILIRKGKSIAKGEVGELIRKGKSITIVKVNDPELGVKVLSAEFPDASCERLGNGEISIMLNSGEIPRLAPLLIGAGLDITTIRDNHTLEAFFLSIADA